VLVIGDKSIVLTINITKWKSVFLSSVNIQTQYDMGIGLKQWCILSPPLFIICINCIDKLSQTIEHATIGKCNISNLVPVIWHCFLSPNLVSEMH